MLTNYPLNYGKVKKLARSTKLFSYLSEIETLKAVVIENFFFSAFFPPQAAAALKQLYVKHPMLYNSSVVCSFEPKVIYRVTFLPHRSISLLILYPQCLGGDV